MRNHNVVLTGTIKRNSVIAAILTSCFLIFVSLVPALPAQATEQHTAVTYSSSSLNFKNIQNSNSHTFKSLIPIEASSNYQVINAATKKPCRASGCLSRADVIDAFKCALGVTALIVAHTPWGLAACIR